MKKKVKSRNRFLKRGFQKIIKKEKRKIEPKSFLEKIIFFLLKNKIISKNHLFEETNSKNSFKKI